MHSAATRKQIRGLIKRVVLGAIKRQSGEGPRDRNNPFRDALMPDGMWRLPRFERSFVTSMGSSGFEELARIIAEAAGKTAQRSALTQIEVSEGQLDAVSRILRGLRENTRRPNWSAEIQEVAAAKHAGATVSVRIISDLKTIDPDGTASFYSMKAPKPNLDQAEKAKSDCLLLKAANPEYKPYFALPYNPYGENRSDYAWLNTSRLFSMSNDSVVLIGREFWERVGGQGAYDEVLGAFKVAGLELKETLDAFLKS